MLTVVGFRQCSFPSFHPKFVKSITHYYLSFNCCGVDPSCSKMLQTKVFFVSRSQWDLLVLMLGCSGTIFWSHFSFLFYHERETSGTHLGSSHTLYLSHTTIFLHFEYQIQKKYMSTRHNCLSQFYKLNIELSESLQIYPP